MREYEKKILDMKVEDIPIRDFLTSRYSMTVRIPVQPTYDLAKQKGIPFFNLTTACILEGINAIPEFKRRIIDNQIIEFEKINAVAPIMQEDHSIREIEIPPPSEFPSIEDWNAYVEDKKEHIETSQFLVPPFERDSIPIANFSCIPWINFDSMTNIISAPHQLMPTITWGKLVDGKIPISLSASHIFIFGWHFNLFYKNAEDYLTHPEKLFQ